jgi:hypothetical protein
MYFFYEETEEVLFTENETNFQRLYGSKNPSLHVKDAFHDYIISGKTESCNRSPRGTKMAPVYRLQLAPADELSKRVIGIFLPDSAGKRPCHGDDDLYASDPFWKDLILFYEYFHGDTGRGCGANHQTGWTGLVARLIISQARHSSG